MLAVLLPASLMLGGACSTALGPRPVIDLGRLQILDPAAFPGQDALVQGFDPCEPMAEWRLGDQVLFGLEVWRGTEVERRLLQLEVVGRSGRPRIDLRDGRFVEGHLTQRTTVNLRRADGSVAEHALAITPIEIEVSSFDAAGDGAVGSEVTLYEELLRTGLLPLATEGDEQQLLRSSLLLLLLQRLGNADPTLGSLLFTVVDPPSVFSVIWHFGVEITLQSDAGRPGTAPAGVPAPGPVHVLPLALLVNGSPALYADLVVADASSPFALAGGVLAAVARHASDPQRIAVLRLLAARRGPAGPEPVRAGSPFDDQPSVDRSDGAAAPPAASARR
jgi:hypothetical protein